MNDSNHIKIVNLTHTSKLGGAEIALFQLMKSSSLDCHLLIFEDGPLVSLFQKANMPVDVISLEKRTLSVSRKGWISWNSIISLFDYLNAARRVKQRILELNPSVVHVNTIKAAILIIFLKRRLRIPVIWHLRDTLAKPYLNNYTAILLRNMARSFNGIIANSAWTLSASKVQSGITVPSPIENEHCNWKYRMRDDEEFHIALVGRISPWKGQDVALKALGLLPENFKLRIIGSALFGEDDFMVSLQELTKSLEIEHRVEFVKFTNLICEQYQWADVSIHTSTIPEPFGQVIIEGMSHGLPVIAAKYGGPTEIIENGLNGLLIEPGDPQLLSEELLKLSKNIELRNDLSSNALIRAADYDSTKVAKEFDDYVKKIVVEFHVNHGD